MAILVSNRLGVGKERYINCFQFFFCCVLECTATTIFVDIEVVYYSYITVQYFFPSSTLVRLLFSTTTTKKTTTTNSSCCPLADGGHSSSSMYSSNTQEVSNTSMANRYKKIKEKFQKEKIKSCHQCCTAAGHRMVGFVRTHTHILFWQYSMRTHTKKSLVLVFEVMQNPINFFGIMSQC